MEMLEPDEFFLRLGAPETWEPMTKCGGEIGPTTTRDELIARGFTSEAADEALRYRDTLRLRGPSDLVYRLATRFRAEVRDEERPTVSRARADTRWWMIAIAEELARFGHYERAAQWLVDHVEITLAPESVDPFARAVRTDLAWTSAQEALRAAEAEIAALRDLVGRLADAHEKLAAEYADAETYAGADGCYVAPFAQELVDESRALVALARETINSDKGGA